MLLLGCSGLASAQDGNVIEALDVSTQPGKMTVKLSLKQPLGMQQHGVLLSSDRRAGFRDQNIHEGDAIRV